MSSDKNRKNAFILLMVLIAIGAAAAFYETLTWFLDSPPEQRTAEMDAIISPATGSRGPASIPAKPKKRPGAPSPTPEPTPEESSDDRAAVSHTGGFMDFFFNNSSGGSTVGSSEQAAEETAPATAKKAAAESDGSAPVTFGAGVASPSLVRNPSAQSDPRPNGITNDDGSDLPAFNALGTVIDASGGGMSSQSTGSGFKVSTSMGTKLNAVSHETAGSYKIKLGPVGQSAQ